MVLIFILSKLDAHFPVITLKLFLKNYRSPGNFEYNTFLLVNNDYYYKGNTTEDKPE